MEKARKAAKNLCLEWEALQSLWKVQLQLGVSFFLVFIVFLRLRLVIGYCGSIEHSGRLVKKKGMWYVCGIIGGN